MAPIPRSESRIVLVEPICRGSRLQVLANVISAIRKVSECELVIVTRRDYHTDHFRELMGDSRGITIRDVELGLSDSWISTLNFGQFDRLLRAVSEESTDGATTVIFMAIDEYLLAMAANSLKLRALKARRVYFIKYRVEYLLHPFETVRSMVLTALTKIPCVAGRAKFICFDERIGEKRKIGSRPIGLLPDPWFGDFGCFRREAARNKFQILGKCFVALTIGRQDSRKGIDKLIRLFPEMVKIPKFKLFVVGKIDEKYRSDFDHLKKAYPANIIHINNFVAEDELPDIFSAADAFLLPYAKTFTATSGTLARAAASGVPVVAVEHGLVGYRVAEYQLGETFNCDSDWEFLGAISRISEYPPATLQMRRDNLSRFAATCTLENFSRAVHSNFVS